MNIVNGTVKHKLNDGQWVIIAKGAGASDGFDFVVGNETITATEIAIHAKFAPNSIPQVLHFSSSGYWRGNVPEGGWGPALRMMRFRGSDKSFNDHSYMRRFAVKGASGNGTLSLEMDYENSNTAAGADFNINAKILIPFPTATYMELKSTIKIVNQSISDVEALPVARELRNQWCLLGVNSNYVADNLTENGIPDYYYDLDPEGIYIGNLDDNDYSTDGWSPKDKVLRYMHDTKYVRMDDRLLEMSYEMPYVEFKNKKWYKSKIFADEAVTRIAFEHMYLKHEKWAIELTNAGGLVDSVGELLWNGNYNRNDTNVLDGDNLQFTLNLDKSVSDWPALGEQLIEFKYIIG